MSKSKFSLLIIMMALSMVCIIYVQAVLIRNTYEMHNESFDNMVFTSLNNAADFITSSQRQNYLNNYNPYDTEPAGFMSFQSYSSIDNSEFSVSVNERYASFQNNNQYSNNQRPHSVRVNDFRAWITAHESALSHLSPQRILEIYEWEKTLDFNNEDIDNALKQTFAYAGIETPFEFALIKNGQVQDSIAKLDFFNNGYMVRLFPANTIRQDVVLSVVFPARSNYVLRQVLWLLVGSLAFSLFIVATFGLSLYFIVRQKKVSEMKSDFLNNMTHEFKTPIATISLAADTISNPKVIQDEEKVRQFVGMIKKENKRMNKKVETILQIASLDKKEIQFNFGPISMHTVIDHVVETIEIQVQQKNGQVVKSYSATNPFVNGDNEHLSHLVNNLLDNAIKYSPANPDITITTANGAGGFIFAVEDKGTGMTKSVQSKIFERFYRQSSGNVHNVKGFGLGLHYVRTIVEAHKGTINVTSELGKGSRFEVFLPTNIEN
jgi:two-component system phosphate regulon sensor histidine kinase PhoR